MISQFYNSLIDLQECIETLKQSESLSDLDVSEPELKAMKFLYRSCGEFRAIYENLEDDDGYRSH